MSQVFENLGAKKYFFTRVTISLDQNLVIIGSYINISIPILLLKCQWQDL